MKLAYFDCFAGASGDMILGALVDCGISLPELQQRLQALPLSGYQLSVREERRGVMAGTRMIVDVDAAVAQPQRSLSTILSLLADSALPPAVIDKASRIFQRLAAAEAKVHGVSVEEVHFHEVGAVDSLVDVVGGLLCLELLGVEQLYSSALPVAPGTVQTAHGTLPLPAPATLELLAEAQAPLAPVSVPAADLGELVTPTAAAFLTTGGVFKQPAMTLQQVGYGVGARDHPALPNVLRVWVGEAAVQGSSVPTGQVQLLETNIDDMNPELYGYVAEQLFTAGALDVWYTSVQMKKGRPGTQVSVLARPEKAAALASLLLQETSTLGVRTQLMQRWEAERAVVRFESSLGPASVKVKRWQGEVLQVAPEYESCRALAQHSGLPLAEVYRRLESEGRAQVLGQGS